MNSRSPKFRGCQCWFKDGKLVEECHYHACARHVRHPNGDPSKVTLQSVIDKHDKAVSGLLEISKRLRTQDNRITCDAMFCVQEQVTVYGLDMQWSDDFVWIDTYDGVHEVPAPADGKETAEVFKTGFQRYWKTVMVAFTEVGAQEYLTQNGHNHRGKTRIYVESFRRCPEMRTIREFLLQLTND